MTGPARYFSALQQIFEEAATALGGPLISKYCIAGLPVCLHFAGQSLARELMPALAHVQNTFDTAASLDIQIWDDASALRPMPEPPWSWGNYMSRGEIGGLDPNRFRAWFHLTSGILSMIDLKNGRALVWVRNADALPVYVTAAPFYMILQAWMSRFGLQFMHAAAVGTPAGGVLLAGAGGSGKSSTSLTCLNAGMDFISDDYCLIATQPSPRAHGLYCSAKVDAAILRQLPGLAPAVQARNAPPDEKALLLLKDAFSNQLPAELPLRALLAPQVCDQQESSLEPVGALAGIRALAPSTMQQIAGPDARTWRIITSLARQLPCYRLRLGHDLTSTPVIIQRLLENLAGKPA